MTESSSISGDDAPDRGIPLTGPRSDAAWIPDPAALPVDPPAPNFGVTRPDDDDELNRALDNALDQIDRMEAAAGRSSTEPTDELRERRLRLRSVLGTMSTRVTAGRSARAAELAVAMAEAGRAAAEATVAANAEDRRRDGPAGHPFKMGFYAGLGLLLAYVTYLCLDTIRSTIIVISIAAVIAIGLDPAVSFFVRRKMRRGMAVTITFLGLLIFLSAAIYAIIPPIVNQIGTLVTNLPQTINHLKTDSPLSGLETKFGLLTKLQNSDFVKNLASRWSFGRCHRCWDRCRHLHHHDSGAVHLGRNSEAEGSRLPIGAGVSTRARQ